MNSQLIQIMALVATVLVGCHYMQLVKFLTEEKGCTLDTQTYRNGEGYVVNALHIASMYGHVDIARFLIEEKQYNPMSKTCTNKTLLTLACQHGHLNMVKYLINKKLIDPWQLDTVCKDDDNMFPLHWACKFGLLDIVKYLVDEQSVDPHYAISGNRTPLHLACEGGCLEIVKFLTEEKECSHAKTFQNEGGFVFNVLHKASVYGHVDVARFLIEEKQCNPMSLLIVRRPLVLPAIIVI